MQTLGVPKKTRKFLIRMLPLSQVLGINCSETQTEVIKFLQYQEMGLFAVKYQG